MLVRFYNNYRDRFLSYEGKFILLAGTLVAAFLLLLPLGTAAGTPVRVAVLELGNPAGLTDAEIAYLSDQVRASVAATLPVSRHST